MLRQRNDAAEAVGGFRCCVQAWIRVLRRGMRRCRGDGCGVRRERGFGRDGSIGNEGFGMRRRQRFSRRVWCAYRGRRLGCLIERFVRRRGIR